MNQSISERKCANVCVATVLAPNQLPNTSPSLKNKQPRQLDFVS